MSSQFEESKNSISLLLLAYNEEDTIISELKAWEKVLAQLPSNWVWQIVVVEDGSTDGTTALLNSWQGTSDRFNHLHEDSRQGYRKALSRGLHYCDSQYIFFSDTGFKNDLDDFWGLFARRDQADLIIGRKAFRRDSIFRRILTISLNIFLRMYFRDSRFHDVDSGFRLFNVNVRNLLLRQNLTFKGFAGCEMVLSVCRAGFDYKEIPVSYVGRTGKSRGLPNRTIPRSILKLLIDLRNFKRTAI
jgi:hypothetical protein